ncbi:MAG: metallophosphoesterase family protein, partial [Gaiellaceae bacterium]
MRSRDIVILATTLLLLIAGGIAAAVTRRSEASETRLKLSATTLLAAGDIAECENQGDEATADILAEYPRALILTLGDNAYQYGTTEQYENCYGPSWGKFKDRTKPVPGNHDHATKNAQGYWDFFGARGGPYDKYYYSFDFGTWHVVALNSDCWRVGGCDLDDPQPRWLRDDLEKSERRCTLVYWHRPPVSSGRYGEPKETERVRPLWQILHEEGADVLLTAHEHSYERFVPMDEAGNRD